MHISFNPLKVDTREISDLTYGSAFTYDGTHYLLTNSLYAGALKATAVRLDSGHVRVFAFDTPVVPINARVVVDR